MQNELGLKCGMWSMNIFKHAMNNIKIPHFKYFLKKKTAGLQQAGICMLPSLIFRLGRHKPCAWQYPVRLKSLGPQALSQIHPSHCLTLRDITITYSSLDCHVFVLFFCFFIFIYYFLNADVLVKLFTRNSEKLTPSKVQK